MTYRPESAKKEAYQQGELLEATEVANATHITLSARCSKESDKHAKPSVMAGLGAAGWNATNSPMAACEDCRAEMRHAGLWHDV
jgi:anti-sigma factor ChrR (cupin superfamily)